MPDPLLTTRTGFSIKPYRDHRPTTDKIIFLSCEGSVTEEKYFDIVSKIFEDVKGKLQFISVKEDAVHKAQKYRTEEEVELLTKSMPWQLAEKIDRFKDKEKRKYEFDKHPEDEFWIVADVDDHTDERNISKWNEVLEKCRREGYGYAVSNPFFEVWLLLHHAEVTDEDKKYAVTDVRGYQPTAHFRERLRECHAHLKDGKTPQEKHYSREKVMAAVGRAKALRPDPYEPWPQELGTTVYRLIEKIIALSPEENQYASTLV